MMSILLPRHALHNTESLRIKRTQHFLAIAHVCCKRACAQRVRLRSCGCVAAMDEVIVRPGNGVLVWNNGWCFRGGPVQVSNFKLGTDISVAVKVNGEADELTGTFFAKGANHHHAFRKEGVAKITNSILLYMK